MSDYIKREDAIKEAKAWSMFGKDDLVSRLERLPSADVVENVRVSPILTATEGKPVEYVNVVRCKDCKYAEIHKEHNVIFCEINELSGRWIKADDYCSYGEERERE